MYVGDIGDYGKYGLLRAIMPAISKLGIVWYMVPNESHLNDGRHTDYLSKLKYIDCDRELFTILKDIISSGKRNISQIEQSDIFPDQTAYYSDYLTYDGIKANTPIGRQNRILRRKQWISDALETVQGCDAIFIDPDNGLETPSVKKHSVKAPKYVYYDEVKGFLSVTDTLIVYHHLSRNGDHLSQIKQKGIHLGKLAGNSYNVMSLRFRPYSPRAYFVITNQESVNNHIDRFLESNWMHCFEKV